MCVSFGDGFFREYAGEYILYILDATPGPPSVLRRSSALLTKLTHPLHPSLSRPMALGPTGQPEPCIED